MEKRGRPAKTVDWDEFKKLCEIHCNCEEIAGIFEMHTDTLALKVKEKFGEYFPEVFKRFAAPGKRNLRRTQFKLAQRNATMSIWLGKQYLDQKDIVQENQVSEGVTQRYLDVMSQLANLQSERRIADSNISNEQKSA